MNERILLQHQAQTLLTQLNQIESWLDRKVIDAQMRRPVRDSFRTEIKRQRKELGSLTETLRQPGAEMADCWEQLRQVRSYCRILFRQYLAFLQGALSRHEGIDNGLCRIADALVDEISRRCGLQWDRFTILADGEQFYDLAGIIRLPFPETTFWTLPLAGHEFGHFAAQEMHGRAGGQHVYYLEAFIKQEARADQQLIAHLNDFFADIFATFTLGPAYAYTNILLRFDPGREDSFNHPGSARRAHTILKTLDLLGPQNAALPPFATITTWLRHRWRDLMRSANQPVELDDAVRQQLDNWTTRLLALLHAHLHDEAEYTGWTRAVSLSTMLMSGQPPDTIFRAGDTLTDVVNAAWLCRLEQWSNEENIGGQAMAACQHLVRPD